MNSLRNKRREGGERHTHKHRDTQRSYIGPLGTHGTKDIQDYGNSSQVSIDEHSVV